METYGDTQQEVIIVGQVATIFFENPTNFYKVLRVKVDDDATDLLIDSEITCTGTFASIHYDTTYEFVGKLTTHPKYGEQFAVSRYQQVTPTSTQGLVDYLASNRFKGIGRVLAQRIVDTLGDNALDVILANPDRLKQVKGMTSDKRQSLYDTIVSQQGTQRIFMQLNQWGFGPKLAEKIYTLFKSDTLELITENPYLLIEKVDGIGFHKADQLAEQLGIEPLAMERLVAGIITAVSEHCMRNGDTYLVREQALRTARDVLEKSRPFLVEESLLEQAADKAILDKKLKALLDGLMIPSLYHAEVNVANRIRQFLMYEHVECFDESEILEKLEQVVEATGIEYDDVQRQAMCIAMKSPMAIVTGGPGTGKTTLVQGIMHLHALLHEYELSDMHHLYEERPILLAAPTGRAAKRMQEMTGLPATTIHRLIGYTRESSVENFQSVELEGKLLIVDEMSMVDTWLMNWLLDAIPYHMQVIFVGDQDQLPSVGPGKVFSDLIESNMIPTISLQKIYRQSADSTIVELAHAIRKGQLPHNLTERQKDRSFIPCQVGQVAHVIQQVVQSAMNKGFDASNMQVLAPMYKGVAGITALNQLLQNLLNPPMPKKREVDYFDYKFRVGDKVLQLVNNAEEGVYNGDIGKIESIYFKHESESSSDELVVSFDDDKELTYKRSEWEQLTLAYCCSVHKSQGSEYPLVILPLVDAYSRMLRKDLVYTAVTRAQKSLVLIGNPNSFVTAVNQQTQPRLTFLKELLQTKEEYSTNIIKLAPTVQKNNEKIEENIAEYEDDSEQLTLLEEHAPSTTQPIALTNETWHLIDPMIGMNGISPYDFM